MRIVVTLVVVLTSTTLARVAGGEPPRGRVSVIRLVDATSPSLPSGLAWGQYVRLGDEERLTLTSRAPGVFAKLPLDARDVVSAPFVVPAEARLDCAIGVEDAGGATPVEFRIAAETDGDSTVLDRRIYDPRDVPRDRRWRDVRVDLSALAGRTIRLRLSTALPAGTPPGSSLPVWADPIVSAPGATRTPNVVIVSLDTLRARSVSAHGAARPTTPALDELVGGAGTIFDAAYTTVPHTLPAHLSLFTGRYLRNLPEVTMMRELAADVPMLAERMRAAGYATAAFTEDGYIIPSIGFRRGFAEYRENTSPDMRMPEGHSAKTFRDGVEWLARHRDQAVFLFLHTYEVHEPYTPPAPYDTAFEPQRGPDSVPQEEQLRYEQEARYLDDQVRALVESIDALGLATRTLLVVLGDHGDEFMEHGKTRHSLNLFEETIHVPLMMRLPGVVPTGLRIETPVSLVDVAPTILDLAGAPPIVGTDGVSLVPLLTGSALPEWRRAVFAEAKSTLRGPGIDLVSARAGVARCTLRMRVGTSLCYDLTRDPVEAVPLGPTDARSQAARTEARAYADFLESAPSNPELASPSTPADPDRAEKLRALGYAE